MKCSAVIFDLDGTLVDSLQDIGDSMNLALKENGLRGHPIEKYRYMVGNGAATLARRAAAERPESYQAVLAAYRAYYEKRCMTKTKPYPGIPNMLEELARLGVRACVFSNKPDSDTQAVVRHFFPEAGFCLVRGQLEGVPVKPDPQGALRIAGELGLPPDQIFYCGDTGVDVQCARNAGMLSVGVTWGFRPREELREAAYIVDAPDEIVNLARRSA